MNESEVGTKPKLILHFDVNETIMIGDPAGGDTLEDCLNKIICKSAYVRGKDQAMSSSQATLPTHWYDGTHVSDTPPSLYTEWEIPDGAVSYYRSGRAVRRYQKKTSLNLDLLVQHIGIPTTR
jgi:hypothetical protein